MDFGDIEVSHNIWESVSKTARTAIRIDTYTAIHEGLLWGNRTICPIGLEVIRAMDRALHEE